MKKLVLLSLLVLGLGGAAQAEDCIFGKTLEALLKKNPSSRFIVEPVGKTFKLNRMKDVVNPLLWVTVTRVFDQKTKRVYHVNATHDDAYDGGNTVGWIEDVTGATGGIDGEDPAKLKGTGAVMAEIHDGGIDCVK